MNVTFVSADGRTHPNFDNEGPKCLNTAWSMLLCEFQYTFVLTPELLFGQPTSLAFTRSPTYSRPLFVKRAHFGVRGSFQLSGTSSDKIWLVFCKYESSNYYYDAIPNKAGLSPTS